MALLFTIYFFDCVVAKQMWRHLSDIFDRELGSNFLSIGQLWLSNKKFLVCNVFSAAVGALEAKKCYVFSGNNM
jgi:hypothetical protein